MAHHQKDDNKPVYFPSINKKYQQYLKMSCYMTYKQIKEEKNEQKWLDSIRLFCDRWRQKVPTTILKIIFMMTINLGIPFCLSRRKCNFPMSKRKLVVRIEGPIGLNCSPFISPTTMWVWSRLQDSGRTYSIERAVPLNNLRSWFFFFFNICVGLGKSQKNKDKNIVSRNGMASKVKNAIHSKYLLFQIMIHSVATMCMKISMSPYIYILLTHIWSSCHWCGQWHFTLMWSHRQFMTRRWISLFRLPFFAAVIIIIVQC